MSKKVKVNTKTPFGKEATQTEMRALAEKSFDEVVSGRCRLSEARELENLIVAAIDEHSGDMFDELQALSMVTANAFTGFDETTRLSILEKYIAILRSRALKLGAAADCRRSAA
jgi:hypothetical protein